MSRLIGFFTTTPYAGFLIACLCLPYLSYLIIHLANPAIHVPHALLIYGGFGLSFWYFIINTETSRICSFFNQKNYYFIYPLHYLSSFCAAVSGMFLIILSNIFFNDKSLMVGLTSFCIISMIFAIFSILYQYTLYIVEGGTLVILNNHLYLPGDLFIKSPLRKYSAKVIDQDVDVSFSIPIRCLDGDIYIHLQLEVSLLVNKAKSADRNGFNYSTYKAQLIELLYEEILWQASQKTIKQFLTELSKPVVLYPPVIPVMWDGLFMTKITNIQ